MVWWPGESEHEEGNGGCMLYLGEESVHWPRGGTKMGTALIRTSPLWSHRRSPGIVLMYDHRGARFLMIQVPLYSGGRRNAF